MCYWIQFASILWRISASVFIRDMAYSFRFLLCPPLILVSGRYWCHRMSQEIILPHWFLRSFSKIECQFFVCLIKFNCESVWSWAFVVVRRFLLLIQCHYSLLVCSGLLFLAGSILQGFIFSGIYPPLQIFQFIHIEMFTVVCDDLLYLYVINCNVTFIISGCTYLNFLS